MITQNSFWALLESVFFLAPGWPNWILILLVPYLLVSLIIIFILTKPAERKQNPKKLMKKILVLAAAFIVIALTAQFYTSYIFLQSL